MMTYLHHRTLSLGLTTLLTILGACTQIGIPIQSASNGGYLDKELSATPARLREDIETYLKARELYDRTNLDTQGNIYIHQNWVQSPSLRYYLLQFDTRKRHLSEWKVLWYVEPLEGNSAKSKLRIAVLELLYLGSPDDNVKAPAEANGNWVETELDQTRATALFEDFWNWRGSRKMSKQPLYLQVSDIEGLPKSRSEVRSAKPMGPTPWWFP